MLLLVKLLGVFFVCRIFKVGAEELEVLLLLNLVLLLSFVEFGFLSLYLLLDHACEPNSEILIGILRDLLAKFLQSLGRCAKLSNLLNFETFSLLFHIF